jgi:tripartite-type tricarboxylate transporter receptor subunit TctC
MRFPKSLAGLLLALLGAWPALSVAQEYPARSIQLIVPATPGTTGDQLARLLGPKLSLMWNVPVVVDNKVGAGGSIGIEAGAKAAPDGYTFLFSATAFSSLPALRANLPYDPVKSFTHVVLLAKSPLVLVVPNSSPARTVQEFIDHVKSQPAGSLNYASPGIGSVHHLTMELFKQQTGLQITHIPYKGTSGALNDLVAGHVQASIVVLQTALPLLQGGKMRLLAVTGPERVAQFPDVPTLGEAGVPRVVSEAWYGVTAPAGTPGTVIAKMNAAMNRLLQQSDVKDALEVVGVSPIGGTPEKMNTLVQNEIRTWAQVVKAGGIKGE